MRWLSAEQDRGALPSGLDPDLLYLSLIGATMYPLLLPHVCRMVTGEEPTAAPFVDRYERHLMALTAALGGGSGQPAVRPSRAGEEGGSGGAVRVRARLTRSAWATASSRAASAVSISP